MLKLLSCDPDMAITLTAAEDTCEIMDLSVSPHAGEGLIMFYCSLRDRGFLMGPGREYTIFFSSIADKLLMF